MDFELSTLNQIPNYQVRAKLNLGFQINVIFIYIQLCNLRGSSSALTLLICGDAWITGNILEETHIRSGGFESNDLGSADLTAKSTRSAKVSHAQSS